MKTYILLFALTFQWAIPTKAISSEAHLASEASLAKLELDNFRKVSNQIFRGARPKSLDALRELKSRGIKSIINLQGGDLTSKYGKIIPWAEPGEMPEIREAQERAALNLGLTYSNIPLGSLDPISASEDRDIDEILDIMNNPSFQPIYIHCEHGIDRTGLIVALYRVKYEGVSPEAARAEWIQLGHSKFRQFFTGSLDTYFFKKVKEFTR